MWGTASSRNSRRSRSPRDLFRNAFSSVLSILKSHSSKWWSQIKIKIKNQKSKYEYFFWVRNLLLAQPKSISLSIQSYCRWREICGILRYTGIIWFFFTGRTKFTFVDHYDVECVIPSSFQLTRNILNEVFYILYRFSSHKNFHDVKYIFDKLPVKELVYEYKNGEIYNTKTNSFQKLMCAQLIFHRHVMMTEK